MDNGTQTQQENGQTVILSDTTQRIVEVVRTLQAITKDKNASRQEQYYARQAVTALNMLIASKVVG